MATSIRTPSRPLGDVDEHFADGATFDSLVSGGGLLEGEAVQRQSGLGTDLRVRRRRPPRPRLRQPDP